MEAECGEEADDGLRVFLCGLNKGSMLARCMASRDIESSTGTFEEPLFEKSSEVLAWNLQHSEVAWTDDASLLNEFQKPFSGRLEFLNHRRTLCQ
jgi:hypothetical protein